MGNKRREIKEIKPFLNDVSMENYDYIVEPFCGSGAFSFSMYDPENKNIKYVLNDNSKDTIDTFNLIKKYSVEEINNMINECLPNITKELWNNITKGKTEYSTIEYICAMLCNGTRYYAPRRKSFKFNKTQLKFIDFIKLDNVIITCGDWFDCFDKYSKSRSLFFIDPPYLLSCNGFYSDADVIRSVNPYTYFWDNDLSTFNCKLFFVLEDNWIIKRIFNKYIIHQYDKIYNMSRKKTTHLVISN